MLRQSSNGSPKGSTSSNRIQFSIPLITVFCLLNCFSSSSNLKTMESELELSSFNLKLKTSAITLVVFGSKTFPDYLTSKKDLLPKKIKYIFFPHQKFSSNNKLQETLKIKKLPCMRLYYGHSDLFSEFSLTMETLNRQSFLFEVGDFIQRRINQSFFSFGKDQKRAKQMLEYIRNRKKGFLFLNLQKDQSFCDVLRSPVPLTGKSFYIQFVFIRGESICLILKLIDI